MSEKDYKQNQIKTSIHWFPGHMAKALREIETRIKMVDLIVELVDARIPYSSKNPVINKLIKNKPRVMVLTKMDLADDKTTALWIDYYKKEGYEVVAVDLNESSSIKKIIEKINIAMKAKREKQITRGMKPQAIRLLVLGIPNVGKSTFINKMAKRKATQVANRPGVTKTQQLIRVGNEFELLDTPGVLWNRFDNQQQATNLAITDAIKNTILPIDDVCLIAVIYLLNNYKEAFVNRYQIEVDDLDLEDSSFFEILLTRIGEKRLMFLNKKEIDYDRVMASILKDVNEKRLGKISWERPEIIEDKN